LHPVECLMISDFDSEHPSLVEEHAPYRNTYMPRKE
jgi:hypothetical protein